MPDWTPESDIDVELVGSFIFANAVMFDCNRVVSIIVSEPIRIGDCEDSEGHRGDLTVRFAGSEELNTTGPLHVMGRIVDLFKQWIAANR